MPVVGRQFSQQSCNPRWTSQHHVPHVINVQACDVGIIGANIHRYDDGSLIRDVLLSVLSKSGTCYSAEHIRWQFDARENVSEDAGLDVLQLLDRVVNVSQLQQLCIRLTSNPWVRVRLLCCLEGSVQFIPTLQQAGELIPFRAETMFEIA